MDDRVETARNIFNDTKKHYNCCQVVFLTFNDIYSIDADIAYNIGTHFGGGMRVKSTCGAISGAVMAMGMLKCTNEQVETFINNFEKKHGNINCDVLLKQITHSCGQRQLCSGFICDCVKAVDNIIKSKTKTP